MANAATVPEATREEEEYWVDFDDSELRTGLARGVLDSASTEHQQDTLTDEERTLWDALESEYGALGEGSCEEEELDVEEDELGVQEIVERDELVITLVRTPALAR